MKQSGHTASGKPPSTQVGTLPEDSIRAHDVVYQFSCQNSDFDISVTRFGKILNVFGFFCGVYLVLGKFLTLLWQILMLLGIF